jgi:hypothetical protein
MRSLKRSKAKHDGTFVSASRRKLLERIREQMKKSGHDPVTPAESGTTINRQEKP